MSKELTIFNFKDQEVRTAMVEGEPWWVAKDVCGVLGIEWKGSGNSGSLSMLDEDERHSMIVMTPGGPQEMTVINEPGLYSLILRSRKKEAKAFKRWVTHEVLPAIRKTGGYTHPTRNPISEIDRMAGMMNQMLPALAGKVTEFSTTLLEQGERLTAVEERQKRIDPRAIEERMFLLHQMKRLLVEGTKDQPHAVTHPGYWRALKEHCKIASFSNRAALDVPTMDRAIEFSRNWCFARGVQPPTLFDQPESPVEPKEPKDAQ